jgi:sugar phosphate isomerase/epimerase
MLLRSSGLIAAVGLAGCEGLAGPGRGGAGRIKLGIFDWIVDKQADASIFEMAAELGLDGAQVSIGSLADDLRLRKPEVQKEFIQAAKKNKVQIASTALGELNFVPYKSDERTDKWVSDSIDVCNAFGCKVVLLAFFADGDLKGDKKGIDVVVSKLKKVAPKAEKAGVALGIESWLSAEDHMDIIQRVGSPAVKVYYDIGNSTMAGYDIYKEIRWLGNNICEFHAKDYKGLFGKGEIDFVEVRRAMDDIGYSGWVQLEPMEFGSLDKMAGLRYDAQYLRELFG